MIIKKIISGGQTGADRAALDVAIKFNIEHGGWIPAGRRAEDGALPEKYNLTEMDTESYPKRTEQNIRNSDGTLIVSRGKLKGGSLLTWEFAQKFNKPCFHIDLLNFDEFEAAIAMHGFVSDHQVEILNVAGPRASHDPGIYKSVKDILETLMYMELMETGPDELMSEDIILVERKAEKFCDNIHDAVALMTQKIHLRTRSVIANCNESEIASLYFSLSDKIKVTLGLDAGNKLLLKACAALLETEDVDVDDAAMTILKELKKNLEKNHVLRIIK